MSALTRLSWLGLNENQLTGLHSKLNWRSSETERRLPCEQPVERVHTHEFARRSRKMTLTTWACHIAQPPTATADASARGHRHPDLYAHADGHCHRHANSDRRAPGNIQTRPDRNRRPERSPAQLELRRQRRPLRAESLDQRRKAGSSSMADYLLTSTTYSHTGLQRRHHLLLLGTRRQPGRRRQAPGLTGPGSHPSAQRTTAHSNTDRNDYANRHAGHQT